MCSFINKYIHTTHSRLHIWELPCATQDAALIVDTALYIVGFPICRGDSEDGEDEDVGCIPSKSADLAESSSYTCQEVRGGRGSASRFLEIRFPSSHTHRSSTTFTIIRRRGLFLTIKGEKNTRWVLNLTCLF